MSFSHQDRKLAEKLIQRLKTDKIPAVSPARDAEAEESFTEQVERAVKLADAVVVVVGPTHEPDERQRREWSAALEATWEDSDKMLIPIVIGDAKAPSFLSGRQVLRVRNPQVEWDSAMRKLLRVLNEGKGSFGEFVSVGPRDRSKRQARLQYIEDAARTLKNH